MGNTRAEREEGRGGRAWAQAYKKERRTFFCVMFHLFTRPVHHSSCTLARPNEFLRTLRTPNAEVKRAVKTRDSALEGRDPYQVGIPRRTGETSVWILKPEKKMGFGHAKSLRQLLLLRSPKRRMIRGWEGRDRFEQAVGCARKTACQR